jgi:predicted acyl esterase
LLPGEPAELRFDMLPISMLFESGHKLRLVISFVDANTPRLDPSPTVSVYRDAAHPSMLSLPVVDP